MGNPFFVTVGRILKEFSLEVIYMPENGEDIQVTMTDIIRPGLPLAGFFQHFDNSRIQLLGMVEYSYLAEFTAEKRAESFDKYFATKFPLAIVTRKLDVYPEAIEAAKKYGVPILRTEEATSTFMASLVAFLNLNLAPRVTKHGVLIEVYGEGVLILGESGIGKSEAAAELVKRGHRLVADDAVEIKRVSNKSLVGTAPEVIRHFIELRGIGIVDVRRVFGMGAVKETEKVELVIELELWDENKKYDRLGMDNRFTEILGLKIPSLNIPVKPGRNLAVIIEVAAMTNRQKRMGYNAAEELERRISKLYNE
ncbi:MAG: HPr(Ser) kinase/phosphatase [Ruminococcaceae bacterium]|nr:HPr(Ser) kinase/phosphatase [Oscillospiraceae bacterium]